MNYTQTSEDILAHVGGPDNIASATHCVTRLRLVLKDESLADDDAVQKIPGVKSVVKQGGQYQVVIGNEVSNLAAEFMRHLPAESSTAQQDSQDSQAARGEKDSLLDRVLGYISGSMTVLLPALLGCGMLKVVLIVLTSAGLLSTDSSTYTFLAAISDSCFQFLPVLLAYGTSKRLGTNPIVSMTIAAVLLYPSVTTILSEGTTGTFLGMPCSYIFGGVPVISTTYASSVLPVLLLAPVIKVVDKWADKVSPNLVKSFLRPMITIFVCSVIGLVVVGPLGGVCGNVLYIVITWLYSNAAWLAVMLLSAFMPLIVMTGMHYAIVPIAIVSLSTVGFDPIICTAQACANVAQGAAAFAVALKAKDTDLRSEAVASGVSASVAGVTEPALYGITMKYKTPLIAAMIGGGVAGCFAGFTKVVTYAMGGSPSLLSLVQMIGGDGLSNLLFGIASFAIAFVVTFIVCLVIYKDGSPDEAAIASE